MVPRRSCMPDDAIVLRAYGKGVEVRATWFPPKWPSAWCSCPIGPRWGCTSIHFVDTVVDGYWQVGLSRRCLGTVERSESWCHPSSCWLDGRRGNRSRALSDHFVDMRQDGY